MPVPEIAALKVQQDDLDKRVTAILAQLALVREGFIERLTRFTEEATAAKLRGVRPLKSRGTHGRTAVDLTLNHFDLVLVSSDQVSPLKADGPLAARVLIYVTSIDSVSPMLDIAVYESDQGPHYFLRRKLSDETPSPMRQGVPSQEEGQRAAEVLINFIYSFELIWNPTPGLQDYLTGGSSMSTIGFRPTIGN